MDASIIVCTYQRADSLATTLDCLARQEASRGLDWEVIVVDNNSSDHTRSTVEAWAKEFPRLRYLFQPQQGLSHARNLGLRAARGQFLLFTDDDVCPEPDWLTKVIEGMEESGCDACGGYIAPRWEHPPPAWLTPRFHGFLALKTERGEPRALTPADELPFGANMAFRRNVFAKIGDFDVHRGRQGKSLASGEDGELFQRALSANLSVWYLPQARVHHSIEAFRMRRRYLWRWRYQSSRNLALTNNPPSGRQIHGIPLYLIPQTLQALVRACVTTFTGPADEAVHRQMMLAHFLGTIAGRWNRAKDHQ